MMSSSKSLFCGGSLSAWLWVAALGCSGNTSLGGADSGVGGATLGIGGAITAGGSQVGGAPASGGKLGTNMDCNLIQCLRAYECVEYCGGPIVSSGCCSCENGTIDQVTACRGSGGNASTGGTASTSSYQPCAGKRCGDSCSVCPPNSTCVETAVLKSCDLAGQCVAGNQQCNTTSTSGGSPGMGGSSATGGASSAYEPCANKKCGETCTLCPPASPDCGETAVMKSCSETGQCLAGNQQCDNSGSGGGAGTGGSAAAGGTSSAYEPCAGKRCGEDCAVCPPNSSSCIETPAIKTCDSVGQCRIGTQQCTNPGSGGSAGVGGSASSGGSTSGVKCGAAVCTASQECCNASCSLCVPKGSGCVAMECSTGGSTSLGGAPGSGGATGTPGIHGACTNGTCPEGLTPVEFYGIAGPSGPLFCSCEIPCPDDKCPTGMVCQYVADGPGAVCY